MCQKHQGMTEGGTPNVNIGFKQNISNERGNATLPQSFPLIPVQNVGSEAEKYLLSQKISPLVKRFQLVFHENSQPTINNVLKMALNTKSNQIKHSG